MLYNGSWGDKTILLNGKGNVTHFNYTSDAPVPGEYELVFKKTPTDKPRRPKRYLLRLINTSFDSTFVFSIDNHWLQIISSDFVPIEPYWNTSILIGIGQRYNVVVEARPQENDQNHLPTDDNFWIRTWIAFDCGIIPNGTKYESYEKTGILRYDESSTARPSSLPWKQISKACSDETYESLRPKVPWRIGQPANDITVAGEKYDVEFKGRPNIPHYPMAHFALRGPNDPPGTFNPLQINYSDPTIFHLDRPVSENPKEWVIIPENYRADQWVPYIP